MRVDGNDQQRFEHRGTIIVSDHDAAFAKGYEIGVTDTQRLSIGEPNGDRLKRFPMKGLANARDVHSLSSR